jgi:signal peptidase I
MLGKIPNIQYLISDTMDDTMDDTPTPTPPPEPTPSPKRGGWLAALLRDLFGTILPAIVIALLIQNFLAQGTRVYGQSMEPNLHTDERLVVEKISYRLHGPRRGHVVVLQDPSGVSPDLLIKRVVALPGERVTVGEGRVYVDGVPLDEPYLTQTTQRGAGRSWIVPPLAVFVMGDTRGSSRDSRDFGAVPLENIVGHAILRYWPPEQIGLLH